jgi:DNA-binding transcriptional LysR family regulator
MKYTSRQLKAFLLAARHQSFSRAADQLSISQSGISMLIRELEEQLGFRLFDRTTRRVALTQFGTKFFPIADRSVHDLETAASDIERAASVANGRFELGATPLMASHLLPTAISEYRVRQPKVGIRLHDADRTRLVALVHSGELDVGLGCFLNPESGVRRIQVFRFSLMVIQPRKGNGQGDAAVRWSDLAKAELVGSSPDNPIQQLIDKQLQRFGRRTPPDMVFSHFETQIAMVEAGAGLGVIPTFAVPACRHRKVSMHQLIEPLVPVELYCIVARGRQLPPVVEAFNTFLKGYIASWVNSRNGALLN